MRILSRKVKPGDVARLPVVEFWFSPQLLLFLCGFLRDFLYCLLCYFLSCHCSILPFSMYIVSARHILQLSNV